MKYSDQGALSRDTAWEGGLIDIDDNKNDIDQASKISDSDTGLSSLETTPYPVDPLNFQEGTVFTQFTAGDSSTVSLTNTGLVCGCGTFRVRYSCP
jgi:regulator of chromosome condensation